LGKPYGAQGVLGQMQKYRIETSILFSAMAVSSDFKAGNQELTQVLQDQPNLYGYFVLNPNYEDESIEAMRTALNSRKFVAAALFVGDSQPFPNLDDYDTILNAYRRFAKPVYIYTDSAEAVMAAIEIAKAFPTIKFILGSMGGNEWKRTMACSKQLNVYLETSGSFDAEKIEEAVANFGDHRVLFGSGSPYADPVSALALVQSSRIPRESMEKILGENARTVFGLGAQG
jgi:predicted TIM-barrel fold metal-dependent hydrolase